MTPIAAQLWEYQSHDTKSILFILKAATKTSLQFCSTGCTVVSDLHGLTSTVMQSTAVLAEHSV